MIVVEMQDDCVERQTFVAADGTAPPHVLEAIEQPIETGSDGVRFLWIARQRVRALVCRAERAGPASLREVLAERLAGTPSRARGDRIGELELIFTRHLVHGALRSLRILRLRARIRICS